MRLPGQDCRRQGGELTEDRRASAPDVVVAGLGSEQGAHRLPERAQQVSEPGRGDPVVVVPPSSETTSSSSMDTASIVSQRRKGRCTASSIAA